MALNLTGKAKYVTLLILEYNSQVLDNLSIALNDGVIMSDLAGPIEFTEAAAKKVALLVTEEENPALKLRVYITGGGCSGFQYGFTFDEKVNDGDFVVEKQGVSMVIDPMSLQYLMGGIVDYTEGLQGSRFVINNPNATTTCGCGSSFSV